MMRSYTQLYDTSVAGESDMSTSINIAPVGVSGSAGFANDQLTAQVQLTGVLVLLLLIAVVGFTLKWPVLK